MFDGHVGSEAASYCVQHMAGHLANSPQFPDKPHLAMLEAFAETDKGFGKTVRQRLGPGWS